MRIRLVHTLSLWLLAAVGVSVLAMGAVSAWNLGKGFDAYLKARDLERLEQLAELVGERIAGLDRTVAIDPQQLNMPRLLRQLERREGMPEAEGRGGPRQPPPRPPGGTPHPFGDRVALFTLDGKPWMGPPLGSNDQTMIERPVRVDGQMFALLRLRPAPPLPDAIDTHFLRSQYFGIAAVASVLILLAVAAAWWLSRQWVQALGSVQEATARIAQGELDVRLPMTRRDEIGDLVQNVNLMAASLQRLEAARRRWIADISHELRTPLASLRCEIEALVDRVRTPSAQALASLRDDVIRLGALVDDLHLLAMADLQRLPCRFTDFDAVHLIEGCIRKFSDRAQAAGISLLWVAPPPKLLSVHWDGARIEQLLSNLLGNSLRYTDAPGSTRLSLEVNEGMARIVVEDTTPGVAPGDLPRLFEPLFRADAARSRQTGGSGLGLSICQAIVHAHGGTIRAEDSTIGGLRIQIDLPLRARGAGNAGL